MIELKVVGGDITRVPADALITTVNSGKVWEGAVDRAIYAQAGRYFHNQVLELEPAGMFQDGSKVLTRPVDGTRAPNTVFRNVIFVIDDLRRPLRDIILRGLNMTEHDSAIQHVTLPLLRTGVMARFAAVTGENPLEELGAALRTFVNSPVASVRRITVVVYNDRRTEEALRGIFEGRY
jgi:O-acetyl-ADP-ribose deacetylase (regulator of RNase III)